MDYITPEGVSRINPRTARVIPVRDGRSVDLAVLVGTFKQEGGNVRLEGFP